MRQRAVIAMALALEPKLLILDEPTTALDVTTQATVLGELSRLAAARGTALLFISHDLSVVSQLCTRTLVLCKGQLVEQGETRALLSSPEHAYTRRLLRSVPELHHPEKILADRGAVP
jgi:ABC-type dipeptide/oligopeptide/nickel transport system ATPase component